MEPGFETLFAAAAEARARAYAPYSGFHVGAAIMDEGGLVHAGCNVENAAYPQSQCAEAGAIAAMVAAGARRLTAVAVLGDGEAPCWPCGGCRQRLAEFAAPGALVIVKAEGRAVVRPLAELLPEAFGPASLRRPA
jgi:cytidine deaminase